MQNFYIISGGPGSGKTALLNALAKKGFACMPEAGRAIIQDQMAIGGSALPSGDKSAFAEQMLCWEMRSYREAQRFLGPAFFDRGVPDVMGYLLLSQLPVPAHVEKAAQNFPYNQLVFLAPHWPNIYTTDLERKQTQAEAIATYNMLAAVYAKLGYQTIQLPLTTVEERVQFVLKSIEEQ